MMVEAGYITQEAFFRRKENFRERTVNLGRPRESGGETKARMDIRGWRMT
jgi:hypothetical protein